MSAARYLLYYDRFSAPCRALYIFMHNARILFDVKHIDLRKFEHLTPEFAKVNPLQTLPTLVDLQNQVPMIESISTVKYLCSKFKSLKAWHPQSRDERRKVNEYLDWHHMNTRHICNSYVLNKVVKPAITGKPASEEKLASYETRVNKCLDIFESFWLKDQLYLVDPHITIADLFAACEIEQLRIAGLDTRASRPIIAAWLKRVADRTLDSYAQQHDNLEKLGPTFERPKKANAA